MPQAILVIVLALSNAATFAADNRIAEVRLKNGVTLRGTFLIQDKLAGRPVGFSELVEEKDEAPKPRNIGRIDNGWQRIYFPLQQRQTNGASTAGKLIAPRTAPITLPHTKRTGSTLLVTGFGGMVNVEDFDEWGRRRLTIMLAKKPMPVFQAITEVSPDHIMVESTNCNWKLGLPLNAVPDETLAPMLKRQFKQDDAIGRFGLVRFYTLAEKFPLAFNELDALERDFPDRKEQIDKQREEIMNYFGAEILRRLSHRKQAGQHELAESFAKKLQTQPLTGNVLQDVKKYIQQYDQARLSIEQAKLLLGDWQAKLNNPEQEEKLQSLRSEVNEQLDFETLPRLDSFLKAEADKQYDPGQRLALAYAGWIMGSANAVTDLDQAIRLAEARHSVLEYLRSDSPAVRSETLNQLKSLEGVSPRMILNMVAQLPPILDSTDARPGVRFRVETEGADSVAYWVMLPAEYTPHHSYPMIVALRPGNRTVEQTVMSWAGDGTRPDLAHQRGYIVIAPEYAENGQSEHTYGAPVHSYVLNCLIDARQRFAVDSDRVFLTGHGMGADAAFDIGFAHPDEFAGVIPIGGNALHYCIYSWQNGAHTAWYVVGKGYDAQDNRDTTSNNVFDNIMVHGAKFDFMLVEYLGRNGEHLLDDFSKIFEWMDLHSRKPQPKELDVRSLRKTDNRFFWLTANGLPRDFILPVPAGAAQKVVPMELEARITPGNTIHVKALTDNVTLRLTPELVDFDNKVVVRIGSQKRYNVFLKPDVAVLLEDLQQRGDRKRLPLASFSSGRERSE